MSATLTTLVSFNGADGSEPAGSLIADADGDLFGTTSGLDPITGNRLTDGTVFEIAKSCRLATPARRPRWSISTAPTARSRSPA